MLLLYFEDRAEVIDTYVIGYLDWLRQKGKFVQNESGKILALPPKSKGSLLSHFAYFLKYLYSFRRSYINLAAK